MRRFGISHESARRGRGAFALAVIAGVVAALLPSAAFADETPTPTPEVTAQPTASPTPAPTDAPEDTTDTEAAEGIEGTAGETNEDIARIPTPDAGDYVGSNTVDEADPGAYSATTGELRPMSLKGFRAGNIISDAKLYTSGTMSAKQMQYFFDKKVPRCDSDYTCLKDFSMKTRTKAPNAYCSGTYRGAAKDTAAQIISKVSKACNVSEKALVVMLQKEQGLVTHTWPSNFRYDIAMGYACPDDAACDERYFGFQNQMYMAAYQLQRYTKDSYFSWYPVGKTSQVRWHPNASCGSGAVRIENKATAALYYYTPYQPNRAAINAGYGIGDSCSAYGNRNFYNYYTDWFGSTRGGEPSAPSKPTVKGPIGEKWRSLGGASSTLGAPKANQVCGLAGGGCRQKFEGGIITWISSKGAHPLQNRTLKKWRELGGVTGTLGYPTTDLRCGLAGGGCYQQFQKGKTYWNGSSRDVKAIWGASMKKYQQLGNENGTYGYPSTSPRCGLVGGGCYQQFQHGKLYWKPGGTAYMVRHASARGYQAVGNENGKLGYPKSDPICGLVNNGCYQKFDSGKLYWKAHGTGRAVWNTVMRAYAQAGNEHSRLGYPIANPTCSSNGCTQRFEYGSIRWGAGIPTRVFYAR